jgi:hypothetical protein
MNNISKFVPDPASNDRLCLLEHAVFGRIPGISFRRSVVDGTPVMVMPFGERDAAVPLRSLQAEFGIPDDSPDGEMLRLIAESLHYVTAIYPGDPLPPEVTSGEASWTPAGNHFRRARIRLSVALLDWQDPAAAKLALKDLDGGSRLEHDPELRTMFESATRRAANELGLPGPVDIQRRLDPLADEFAYIEALRDTLHVPVRDLMVRAKHLSASLSRHDAIRLNAISGVIKMSGPPLADLDRRFASMDDLCRDVVELLRSPDLQVPIVRENRDTLYRTQRGWQPVLEQWAQADERDDGAIWMIVASTYQFLARRYLDASEWPAFDSLRSALATSRRPMMRW